MIADYWNWCMDFGDGFITDVFALALFLAPFAAVLLVAAMIAFKVWEIRNPEAAAELAARVEAEQEATRRAAAGDDLA